MLWSNVPDFGIVRHAFSTDGLLLSGHRGNISCSVFFSGWSVVCAGVTSAVSLAKALFCFGDTNYRDLGENEKYVFVVVFWSEQCTVS